MLKKIFLALIPLFIFAFFIKGSLAVTLDEINKELSDISQKLTQIKEEQDKLKKDLEKTSKELNVTVGQIDELAMKVDKTRNDIAVVETALEDRQTKLEYQKKIRDARVRNFYKKTHVSTLELFFNEEAYSRTAENQVYQLSTLTETKHLIENLNKEIVQFEKDKEDLVAVKKELEASLGSLQAIRNSLANKKNQTNEKLSKTEAALKSLSARQEELLALKTASFSTSVGEVSLPDDFNSSLGFKPPFSPAFAVFSYGAPHRVGMSQYGAYGRAKAGQDAETILKAYFSNVTLKKDYAAAQNINVSGYGAISFEDDYLKGIAEMPSSWGDASKGGLEALKAQAVAARTYALAVTKGGGTICPTEACQVYIGYNKGGNWERAVNETKGWVLVDSSGNPIKSWYASTTGGFTHSSAAVFGGATSYAQGIVDTTCGSTSCWTSESYEVKANSPWFYKAWYKNRNGDAGGRTHPWLTGEQMADILNSIMLFQLEPSLTSHLSQHDASNPDTWSSEKIKEEIRSRGGTPVNKVISVDKPLYHSSGYTSSVNFVTDAGNKSFSGNEFRLIFNLRAPGRLWIPSLYSGSQPLGPALFNIEQK